MSWKDDLETVVARTRVERYRFLCSEEYHDHERMRVEMVRMAALPAEAPRPAAPAYPPLAEQVGNALKAGLRFLASGCKLVDQAEHDRREAICSACEFHDAVQERCTKCGCVDSIQLWIETKDCPDKPSRWIKGLAAPP